MSATAPKTIYIYGFVYGVYLKKKEAIFLENNLFTHQNIYFVPFKVSPELFPILEAFRICAFYYRFELFQSCGLCLLNQGKSPSLRGCFQFLGTRRTRRALIRWIQGEGQAWLRPNNYENKQWRVNWLLIVAQIQDCFPYCFAVLQPQPYGPYNSLWVTMLHATVIEEHSHRSSMQIFCSIHHSTATPRQEANRIHGKRRRQWKDRILSA